MRFKMMAFVAAALVAAPVAAQTADPAAPAAAPKKEKKVCRRLDQTGSILGSRPTCHTKAEWMAIDEANGRRASQSLDNNRRPGGTGTSSQF